MAFIYMKGIRSLKASQVKKIFAKGLVKYSCGKNRNSDTYHDNICSCYVCTLFKINQVLK